MTKCIDLVYFNAGGGHRAAALALQEVIALQRRPWTVRLVNLAEVLDAKGTFRRVTGMAPEDLYNRRLARGWTLGLAQELKLLQGLIRLGHSAMLRPLQQHWLATEPDLVVSLVPNFNRVHVRVAGDHAARRAVCDGAHRHGRPAAAFLDRARPGPAPRLRHARGRGTGPRRRLPRHPHLADLGNDPAPGLLSAPSRRPRVAAARRSASTRSGRPAW